jgi:transposase-like protein
MKLPEYVTKDEVKRVCKELGIGIGQLLGKWR